MKFSVVAALVVVLAVAHGSEAGSLVKRHAPSDIEKLDKLVKDMTDTIKSASKDLMELVKAFTDETHMKDTKIQPLIKKIQTEVTKLQKQVKSLMSSLKEQIKPLKDNFSSQVKTLTDMIGKSFQQVLDQAKALLPHK